MLILFDHGTPRGLIQALSGHTVITAQSRGWDRLSNGALLNAAEQAGLPRKTDPAPDYSGSRDSVRCKQQFSRGKVKVYRVQLFDYRNGQRRRSFDMVTRAGAARMKGNILEDIGIENDQTGLETGYEWAPATSRGTDNWTSHQSGTRVSKHWNFGLTGSPRFIGSIAVFLLA
ncbi:MAG: hypothetical protein JO307_17330 [Bryobacterales bacterium]|nr:hypothetical protein [Bryobacterales bacterium]